MKVLAVIAAVAIAVTASGLVVRARGGEETPRRTYVLSARQASEVAVTVRFIDAYNGRRLSEALALVTPDVLVSDCDHRTFRKVGYRGKQQAARWLRERFRDRDRFVVERIFNENDEQPEGGVGLAVLRRTSDTLRARGFPNGTHPEGSTKVLFTARGSLRIRAFVAGC